MMVDALEYCTSHVRKNGSARHRSLLMT